MKFIESEKELLINTIEEACLNHNFGTLYKADFDLLVFHHYMESIRKSDAFLTNYEISKQLGITVQRVVSLKDKEASRYPYDESSWKKEFLECFSKSYVSGDKLVISITDRRLYRELESYLEKQGLATEYDLNPSVFKAEPERFVEAIKELYPGNEIIIDEIEEVARRNSLIEDGGEDKTGAKALGKFVAEFAKDVLAAVISNKIAVMI